MARVQRTQDGRQEGRLAHHGAEPGRARGGQRQRPAADQGRGAWSGGWPGAGAQRGEGAGRRGRQDTRGGSPMSPARENSTPEEPDDLVQESIAPADDEAPEADVTAQAP